MVIFLKFTMNVYDNKVEGSCMFLCPCVQCMVHTLVKAVYMYSSGQNKVPTAEWKIRLIVV